MGVHALVLQGVRGAGVTLVSDSRSQPTATTLMPAMSRLGIESACLCVTCRQVLTRAKQPKGTAEAERPMRTIKEALRWLRKFTTREAARVAMRQWIEVNHKQHYVRLSLGYKSPMELASILRQRECLPAAAQDASRSTGSKMSRHAGVLLNLVRRGMYGSARFEGRSGETLHTE